MGVNEGAQLGSGNVKGEVETVSNAQFCTNPSSTQEVPGTFVSKSTLAT